MSSISLNVWENIHPQEPRMEVIPNIILHDVFAAVLGAWKSGPPPPFVCTDHMVRPNKVLTTCDGGDNETVFCNFSGGTNT